MKPRFAIAMLLVLALAIPATTMAQGSKTGEEIGTFQQLMDGNLYPDIEANTLRNMDRLCWTRVVKHGEYVYPLPKSDVPLGAVEFTSGGKRYDLYDYMALNRVSGLLILKNGKIALERYNLGSTETSHWCSFSVGKGITATLVGAAIQDGYIKSVDEPITRYLPELAGTAYDGVTIKNVLQMASGVKWDETYTNPKSDFRRMIDARSAGNHAQFMEILKSLPRESQPGTIWLMNSGQPQLIAELLSAAVKQPLSEYLSERVWAKFGMESDAQWCLDSPNGLEIGGGSFNTTLRDFGRFGLFIANGGIAGGQKIIPDWWMAQAGTSKMIGDKMVRYGYMWWIPDEVANPVNRDAFEARGIFGQGIYINPKENVVIVVLSARPKPTGMSVISDQDFYAAVVKALH